MRWTWANAFWGAAAVGLAASMLALLTPLAGTAFTSWRVASWGLKLWNLGGSGKFLPERHAPGVYRLDLWWQPLPIPLARAPLTAFLVHDQSGDVDRWVLVDAGASDRPWSAYASRLAAAVRKKLPPGEELHAILLTHGHYDHVGALPALLKDHPRASVFVHAEEVPFLVGPESYMPPRPVGGLLISPLQALGVVPTTAVKVPRERVQVLEGSSGGSLRAHGMKSLRWVATPGHSPGHVAYLHEPSGTLILGDALTYILPTLHLSEGLTTRPFRWALNAAAGLAPPPLRRALGAAGPGNSTVMTDHVAAPAMALMAAGGDLRSTNVLPRSGSAGEGVMTLGAKFWLPGVGIRITPAFMCAQPHCNEAQGERSICSIAGMKGSFKRALPMHDLLGHGLTPEQLQAFAAALPACR